jgi:phosphoadenosine phosphosulfate reductase
MANHPYDPASNSDVESGYASASPSEESLTEIFFTKPHLRYLNKQLKELEPQGEDHLVFHV